MLFIIVLPTCLAPFPVTSTNALNKVTLPYIRKIAKHGLRDAFKDDPGLMRGLNIKDGKIVHQSVIDSLSSK
jgi:alanine dehydrogenase